MSFGGPGGSCGGSEGSRGVLRRAGGVLGGPWKRSCMFSLFRGEFVNSLITYWCLQFWVILWGGRRSLRYAIFCCCWKLAFCETVKWICYKKQCVCFNGSNIASSELLKIWCRQLISGGEFWGPGWSIVTEILLFFFNMSAFAVCVVSKWITKCDAFARKWKSEY